MYRRLTHYSSCFFHFDLRLFPVYTLLTIFLENYFPIHFYIQFSDAFSFHMIVKRDARFFIPQIGSIH